MCGRIFQIHNIGQLMRFANAAKVRNAAAFNPTYNMGPTNYIPAIREIEDDDQWDDPQEQLENVDEKPVKKRGLDFMKWGYQTKFTMILNARVEEMHEKHTFKPLLNTRRCVVIADGYYEWNPQKQPFKFDQTNQKPLYMAAMYTAENEVFLLTRDAFGDFEKVHHRMPVLLEEDEIDLWINCKNSFHDIIDKRILNQQKKIWSQVKSVQVAPFVNNMKEKSEKCQITYADYKEQQFKKGIGKFFQKKEKPQPEEKQLSPEKIQKAID